MKVDLDSLPCPAPSMIIGEILKRHLLKDSLTFSSSAPIIYMQQLWYTLQLADSKEDFKFTIDQQETLNIPRTPKLKSIPEKKREEVSGESSAPKTKLKLRIRAQQPDPVAPILTIAEIKKDHLIEAQQVSLAKSAKEVEARENIKLVTEAVLEEDVDKLVEGIEEEADERSPKIDLSSDKGPATELTETNIHISVGPSRSSSYREKHLKGIVARIRDTFDKEVFPLVEDRMEDIVKANLCHIIR
ncbi:hypothetical protein Tco_0212880 [Tanacetum coccineum]